MIVRAVLDDRRLIEKIDFFNDGKDTLGWLKGMAIVETGETARKAIIAAFALRDEMEDWEFRRAYGCVPADIPKILAAGLEAISIAEAIINDEYAGTHRHEPALKELLSLKEVLKKA